MLFAKGFDGKISRVDSLIFSVAEDSIALAKNLPRQGTRWHKHLFLPRSTFKFAFIICLVTSEGKFTIFKACHLCLLAHFILNEIINSPFYFIRSLEKMSSQVRKNIVNPVGSLYHYSLIELLIVHQLKETERLGNISFMRY